MSLEREGSVAEDLVSGAMGDDFKAADEASRETDEQDESGLEDQGVEQGAEQDQGEGEGQGQGEVDQSQNELRDPRLPDDEQAPRVTHTEDASLPPQGHLPQHAEVKPDRFGNLVAVDAQGNVMLGANKKPIIIASAGREARLYQGMQKVRQQLHSRTEQFRAVAEDISSRLNEAVNIGKQLHAENEQLKQRGSVGTTLGLNANEEREYLELGAMAKTDLPGAIKKILTKAAVAGMDMSQLGLAPGGFDPKMLVDTIRQELAKGLEPAKNLAAQNQKATEQRETARQADAQTLRNTQLFFAQNPEAKPFLPAIKRFYDAGNNDHVPLELLWTNLKLNLLERGIDYRNPQASRGGNQNRRKPSMPSGRSQVNGQNLNKTSPVNETWEDIVKASMKEAGYGSQPRS